jgi:hypothetical protein
MIAIPPITAIRFCMVPVWFAFEYNCLHGVVDLLTGKSGMIILKFSLICFSYFMAGRLPRSARLYGEVFVNGTKSQMPYGSYVSA